MAPGRADSSRDEAQALAGLGRCALAVGRPADALVSLKQAQSIFKRLGSAEETEVAADIGALTDAPP